MTQSPWGIRCGFILTILFGTSPSAWGNAEEMARFEREFPAAAKRLEERFSRVKGSCRLWTKRSSDTLTPLVNEADFAIDHGYEKVAVQRKISAGGKNSKHFDKVYCVGPNTVFTLMRLPDAKDFLVEKVGSTSQDRAAYLTEFGRLIKAHVGVFGFPMTQIMAGPYFRLTNAERTATNGRDLVKVDYEVGTEEPFLRASVVFDPDAGWAVRSSDCRFGLNPGPRFVTDVEYGPSRDGLPLPRRVAIRDETGETAFCEFVDWSFEPTPEREFGMPYYGLPDLVARVNTPRIAPIYWLSGIAAAGLAAALMLRRFATHRMRPSRA